MSDNKLELYGEYVRTFVYTHAHTGGAGYCVSFLAGDPKEPGKLVSRDVMVARALGACHGHPSLGKVEFASLNAFEEKFNEKMGKPADATDEG